MIVLTWPPKFNALEMSKSFSVKN